MKFRVKNEVSCFGVGTTTYYPGDILEGPEEWKANKFLEPLPEPAKPIPTIAVIPAEPETTQKKPPKETGSKRR